MTTTKLTRQREAWDEPFLADPRDEAANTARGVQTRALAAALLSAPLGTRAGSMTVATAGWSRERAAEADAAGPPGSPEWLAALGAHEDAVLTSDGRPAIRDAWCTCPNDDVFTDQWVRYEAWTERGCEAHGFVHATCRKLLQTG